MRQRLAEAGDPALRRALEEVLGRVGGKDAFAALLVALDTPDIEAARAAALAVRQRIKETTATPREKASYLAQVTKFIQAKAKTNAKTNGKTASASLAPLTGGLKILGFLEDPAAVPTLLTFARDKRQPVPVREEAIVALRFVARGKPGARVAVALQELAERAPAELARPALYTMASLDIPGALVARLKKLALGREPERALLAIERLAQVTLPAGADALAAVLTATEDRVRAEAAAAALGARPGGCARAGTRADRDARRRAGRAAGAPASPAPARADRSGRGGQEAGEGRWWRTRSRASATSPARRGRRRAAVAGARHRSRRDRSRAARAGRQAAEAKGRRAALAVLRLVGHANDATPDDGYALAAAELRAGRRDEALAIVQQLVERGFDLAAALRRDRLVTPEQRYQVGFSLVERRHPAGEEVLTDLAGSGRSKIASMAKAKLKSAGYS